MADRQRREPMKVIHKVEVAVVAMLMIINWAISLGLVR